jgi:hypothetical protein
MINSEIKLTKAQKVIMLEAANRYLLHNFDKPIEECLLGLGSPSTYKCVQQAGLMKPLNGKVNPRTANWWYVTPNGAKVIKKIIREFAVAYFDHTKILEVFYMYKLTEKKLIKYYSKIVQQTQSSGEQKFYISHDFSEVADGLNCHEIHKLFQEKGIIPKNVTWDHEHSCCYYYFSSKKSVNVFINAVAKLVYENNNSIRE